MFPKRNMSNEAIRKRQYRKVEKEKKRERTFMAKYLEIKYPATYNEIKDAYKEAVDRYPNKTDITKTYLFKKWADQILGNRRGLMTPQLPILEPLESLQSQQQPPVPGSSSPVPEPSHEIEIRTSDPIPPSEIQEQPPVPTETGSNVISGLTLQEMEICTSELCNALQNDRELMDLVESFDLPDGVWENELAVPDYVLESDLDW